MKLTATDCNTRSGGIHDITYHTVWCTLRCAYCNTLKHAATHCNTRSGGIFDMSYHTVWCTLQHVYCNTSQHTATYCNTLQHAIRWHIWHELSHSMMHITMRPLQHTATYCNTLQHANRWHIWHSLSHMGWLRLVGSLKSWVSFAKEPYKRDYILQKRPVILMSLLIVATPYHDPHHKESNASRWNMLQHTATHCITQQSGWHEICDLSRITMLITMHLMQHTATHCNTRPSGIPDMTHRIWQCTFRCIWNNTLQDTARHCKTRPGGGIHNMTHHI